MTLTPKRTLKGVAGCRTPGDWLAAAQRLYVEHGLALGQVALDPHDEALYLILHTLGFPMDSDPTVMTEELDEEQHRSLHRVFARRILDHTPAAYITREAWLGEHCFYIDERALIPRSYFLEVIPGELDSLLPDAGEVTRVVDVCTGSGCLAILLAHHFPKAKVDAIDLSNDALDVARINVREHRLEKRVQLIRSDVFDAVPPAEYDLILSNPPYEPSAHCDKLPAEFRREPRMALDGGADGLDIIRKLLRQARTRLKPGGIVLIEVGGLMKVMDREFAALGLRWLETEDGSNCICLVREEALRSWEG